MTRILSSWRPDGLSLSDCTIAGAAETTLIISHTVSFLNTGEKGLKHNHICDFQIQFDIKEQSKQSVFRLKSVTKTSPEIRYLDKSGVKSWEILLWTILMLFMLQNKPETLKSFLFSDFRIKVCFLKSSKMYFLRKDDPSFRNTQHKMF